MRRPISRVRSVTLMNITLAIPMAPMRRLMAASPTVANAMRVLMPSNVEMIWSAVERLKSFGASAGSFRSSLRIASSSAEHAARCPGLART